MKAYYFILVLVAIFAAVIVVNGKSLTGNAVLELQDGLKEDDPLTGNIIVDPASIVSKFGSLPADSIVEVRLNDYSKKMPLADFLSEDYKDFYQSNAPFYPNIKVAVNIKREIPQTSTARRSSGGRTSSSGTTEIINPPNEEVKPVCTNPITCFTDLVVPLITGRVTDSTSFEREAIVSFNSLSPGTVELSSGENIVDYSAYLYDEPFPQDYVELEKTAFGTKFTTRYYEILPGFESSPEIVIDLADFGFNTPPKGVLRVNVLYNGNVISSAVKSFGSEPALLAEPKVPILKDANGLNELTEEVIHSGCSTYTCISSDGCASPSISDLSENVITPIKTEQCTWDCGKKFIKKEACDSPLVYVDIKEADGSNLFADSEGHRVLQIVNVVEEKPVAYLDFSQSRMNIIFLQSRPTIYPECKNGQLDEGEEDIDCGGYCSACREDKQSNLVFVPWVLFFALIFGFVIFLFYKKSKSPISAEVA